MTLRRIAVRSVKGSRWLFAPSTRVSRNFMCTKTPESEEMSEMHADFKAKYKPPTSTGSVVDLIEKDITENQVFLYMKGYPNSPMCGFSAQVVGILKKLEIPFASRNVLDNLEVREGIKKFSDWPTVPQLYVRGEFVGGCDIVTQMYQSNELEKLLSPIVNKSI